MSFSINRKCQFCKTTVDITSDEAVCEKNKYYHLNCFIEMKLSKKRNKPNRDDIMRLARRLQEENKQNIKLIIDKENLYKWIQNSYNIMVLPSYFFIKMESIYDGSFKGLRCGIPPEHILDMWKRKKNYLDNIYNSNKQKGKTMDLLGRVNYDLAVLINKYDGYLAYLAKQKIIEEQNKTLNGELQNLVQLTRINAVVDSCYTEENDLSNILDEVF